MNINNIISFNNNQINTSTASQQANDISSDAKNAANVVKLLNNTSAGDFLQGTIVSTDGSDIVINLGNNTLINASLNAQADLSAGQSIVFSVKSSDSSGLILSPLYTNTDASSTLSKALENAGLISNERNMTIVNSMMKEGLNIGHDEVIEMARSLGQISTGDIPDAITLTKLGIEPNTDNVEQFNAYLNYQHQISGAVSEIMDLIPDTISDMFSNGDDQAALKMTGDLLDIFTSQGAMQTPDSETMSLIGMDTPLSDIISGSEMQEFSELMEQNGIDPAFSEAVQNGQVSFGDTLYVIDSMIKEYAELNNDISVQPANPDILPQTDNSSDILTGNQDSAGKTDFISNTQFSGNTFLQQLLNARNNLESKSLNLHDQKPEFTFSENSKSDISDLITSKTFSKLLKTAVNNQWKLTPEQVGEDKEVSNLYKRMTEQTGRILNALQSQAKADSPLGQESSQLSKNINFMNEMNNMFNYVQLPMRLSGNDAHGELYVYTNKKHMASNDGTVSAMLHLDMDNLGPTDVYVAMNTSNHVNTHFYLQDDTSLDLIAMHIDELNERLEKRGYSVTAEFTKKDGETNIMQEIVSENSSSVPVSISNFDAKA